LISILFGCFKILEIDLDSIFIVTFSSWFSFSFRARFRL